MPFRKRPMTRRRPRVATRGRNARRTFRRKVVKYHSRPTYSIVRGRNFSDKQFVRLRYSDTLLLTSTGGLSGFTYRGNSMFDPQFTVGGHQPHGFDQWSTMYDKYLVYGLGCSIVFTAIALSQATCYTQWSDVSTLTANINNLKERSFVKRAFTSSANGGNSISRIKDYMSIKKVLGLTTLNESNRDYTALISADPVDQCFLNIFIHSTDLSTTSEVAVSVDLTYYAVMYDRKQLGQS